MLTADQIIDQVTTTSRMAATAATLESVCLRVMRTGELSAEYRAMMGYHLAELLRLASELGIKMEVRAMTLAEAIETIEAVLVVSQGDGADSGDIADALRALEQLREVAA